MTVRQKANVNDRNAPNFNFKLELVNRAYKYFLKGLTAKETAKLMDISERTVQRWITDNDFAETATPTTNQQKAVDLSKNGLSYTQIAKVLKCSKGTVYNYIKEARRKATIE